MFARRIRLLPGHRRQRLPAPGQRARPVLHPRDGPAGAHDRQLQHFRRRSPRSWCRCTPTRRRSSDERPRPPSPLHRLEEPVPRSGQHADPLNRQAAPRYRGFHQNDMAKCIGCGTCEAICQNGAIDMVPVAAASRPERRHRRATPACAPAHRLWPLLLVRPVRRRLHDQVADHVERLHLGGKRSGQVPLHPGVDKKPGTTPNWAIAAPRAPPHRPARIAMASWSPRSASAPSPRSCRATRSEQAVLEADRCVSCGLCIATCPTHMAIPNTSSRGARRRLRARRAALRQQPLLRHLRPGLHPQVRDHLRRAPRGRCHRHPLAEAPHHGSGHAEQCQAGRRPRRRHRQRVAIIGAGPAGLTAAFDLAKLGHAVTVYEALDKPGGMTRWGIPEYRLPYEAIDQDVDVIRSLGVDIRCNTAHRPDISWNTARPSTTRCCSPSACNSAAARASPAATIPTCARPSTCCARPPPARTSARPVQAVVIGGGNVAMDIARTLARLQKARYGEVKVTLTALEDLAHFLADPDEIKEAGEEGVSSSTRAARARSSSRTARCRPEDLAGQGHLRRAGPLRAQLRRGDEQFHPGDMVVEAIGQMTDTGLLGDALTEQLAWNRGRLQTDAGGRTSEAWLWAAGDMVRGPDVVTPSPTATGSPPASTPPLRVGVTAHERRQPRHRPSARQDHAARNPRSRHRLRGQRARLLHRR
jgi:glutamate synthase (NADPH) small chain